MRKIKSTEEKTHTARKASEFSTEKMLIGVALFFCALIVGYNAFYVPQSSLPVSYGGESEDSVSLVFDEEYEALPFPESAPSQLLDINTVSKEQLEQTLPGIGPLLAQRIVEYRESQPFQSIEDLKKVEGIGEKTFQKIKPYVTVNQ